MFCYQFFVVDVDMDSNWIIDIIYMSLIAIGKIKIENDKKNVEITDDIEETYQHPDIKNQFPKNDFQDDEVEL